MSPEAYCAPCKSRGTTTVAHRLVNRVPKCDACYRNDVEVLKPIGKDHPETQGKVLTDDMISERIAENVGVREVAIVERKQVDWAKVQNERSDGVSVKELALKYGVSDVSIYTKTRPPKGKERSAPAKKGGRPRKPQPDVPASGRFSEVIAALAVERDKLNEAIATLEQLAR